MKQEQRAPYAPPTLTDLGKVSVVTASVGGTFLTDSNFEGSMVFQGMGGGMG